MMKKISLGSSFLAAIAVIGASALLHGLYSPKTTLAAEATNPDSTITIRTFQFQPNAVELKAGTRVTWINQDEIRHTVTSGTPEKKDGRFDSTLAGKGASFSFTFAVPGTYTYFCDRHQHMVAEIRVK